MIWGLEGRHLWAPPPAPDYFTAARLARIAEQSLIDYISGLDNLALYWTGRAEGGAQEWVDRSPNNRDGVGLGTTVPGTGESLTATPGDTSTEVGRVVGDEGVATTAYSPFTGNRTFFGISLLDDVTPASGQNSFFGRSVTGSSTPRLYLDSDNDVEFTPGTGTASWADVWAGLEGTAVIWALTFNDTTNEAELWIDGVSQGVQTSATAWGTNGLLTWAKGGSGPGFVPAVGAHGHFGVVEGILEDDEIKNIAGLAQIVGLLVLNRRVDDLGVRVFPCYNVSRIGGLMGTGDSGDLRVDRVGAEGEIPRRSYRRGKTISYEGLVQAQDRLELRDAEETLRSALTSQRSEGLMVVTPHPALEGELGSGGEGPVFRYFNARALACEIEDEINFGPGRPYTRGHESAFAVTFRNARADGFSYYDENDGTYP